MISRDISQDLRHIIEALENLVKNDFIGVWILNTHTKWAPYYGEQNVMHNEKLSSNKEGQIQNFTSLFQIIAKSIPLNYFNWYDSSNTHWSIGNTQRSSRYHQNF